MLGISVSTKKRMGIESLGLRGVRPVASKKRWPFIGFVSVTLVIMVYAAVKQTIWTNQGLASVLFWLWFVIVLVGILFHFKFSLKRTQWCAYYGAYGIAVVMLGVALQGIFGQTRRAVLAQLGGSTPQESLENFFSVQTKQGIFRHESFGPSGNVIKQEMVTFWIDGRDLRLDYRSMNNDLQLSVIAKNGVAYFCYEYQKVCEVSPLPVDYYLARFVKPEGALPQGVKDKPNNCKKFTYSIKKNDALVGSANPWYTEDRSYCLRTGELVTIESRGGVPDSGGRPKNIIRDVEVIQRLETGMAITRDVFALPYTINDNKR